MLLLAHTDLQSEGQIFALFVDGHNGVAHVCDGHLPVRINIQHCQCGLGLVLWQEPVQIL